MRTRDRVLKTALAGIALAGVLAVAAFAQQEPQEKSMPLSRTPQTAPKALPSPTGKSLFDRLGGTYPIAAMVDDYIDNLVLDPVVMANPQVKASVQKAAAANGVPGLKYQISAFVIEATGGPYKYHGKNMKDTHATLRITQAEWDASAAVFRSTLTKFKVPAKEQEEIFAIINTTHDDIVIGGKAAANRP